MSVKIPSAKKVPAPKELIKRGGALELVGYLDSQLSVWGKVRGFFGKESYQYDKIVATAKDMVKNLEEKEHGYFGKGNLGLPIDIEFMTLLFKMLENYVKEGTNKDRKLSIKNKILTKKKETMRRLNEQKIASAAANQARQSPGKAPSTSCLCSNLNNVNMNIVNENNVNMSIVNENNEQVKTKLSEIEKKINSAVPGDPSFNYNLNKAEDMLNKLIEFVKKFKMGDVTIDGETIDAQIKKLQSLVDAKKKTNSDLILTKKLHNRVLEVRKNLESAVPGSRKCDEILERANNTLVDVSSSISTNSEVVFPEYLLQELNEAYADISKKTKAHKCFKIDGDQVVVEHKGGLYVHAPKKATVSEIVQKSGDGGLSARLQILKGSDLLGGQGHTGNYQLFEVGEKKMNESWSKVAPSVTTNMHKTIKAMKRDDMFRYILESYDEGKWKEKLD